MPSTRTSRGRDSLSRAQNNNLLLEKVIGSTTKGNIAFAVNPVKDEFAFIAGCVVVISAANEDGSYEQKHFLVSGQKTITTVAYSPDGKYLAVGEKGKDPAVNVWRMGGEPKMAVAIDQHRFGVAAMAFNASGDKLVTCGVQHDGMCHVWDTAAFESGKASLIASVRVAVVINAVSFFDEGTFVTVGKRHVKFWCIGTQEGKTSIEGRTAVLGTHRRSTFVQVERIDESCLAVTDEGHLCSVVQQGTSAGKPRFQISKFVDLQAGKCFSLCATDKYVICGCSNGAVAILDKTTLEHVADLPRPTPLGATTGDDGATPTAVYPDILAARMTSDSQKMGVFYSDGSFRLWAVSDVSNATLLHEAFGHSQAVWDIQVHPSGSSFATCSADNTIRLWDMSTIFSVEDQSVTAVTRSTADSGRQQIGLIHTDATFKNLLAADQETSEDSKSASIGGVRCMSYSPDSDFIASGDRSGNVRVHHIPSLQQVHFAAAHDSEVLSVSYSASQQTGSDHLLATASRDRLIHVFKESVSEDNTAEYELLTTVDDHSSSITKVKFLRMETGDDSLLSCGADKSLIFRTVAAQVDGTYKVERFCNAQATGTIYDMDVDAKTGTVVSSGKDKKFTMHDAATGKSAMPSQKTKASTGDIVKLQLDASGHFAVTSSTDKGVRIYDLQSKAGKRNAVSECVAEGFCTSEVMTAVAVLPTSSHLLTVSGGGCIYVWKIEDTIAQRMQASLGEEAVSAALASIQSAAKAAAPIVEAANDAAPIASNAEAVFEQFVAENSLPTWASGATETAELPAFGAAPATNSKWALGGSSLSIFSGETIGAAPAGPDFASIFGGGNASFDPRRLTIEPSEISENEASREEAAAEAEDAAAIEAPIVTDDAVEEEEAPVDQAITEVESDFVNFQSFSAFGAFADGQAKPRLSLSAAFRSEHIPETVSNEVVEKVAEEVVEEVAEVVKSVEEIEAEPENEVAVESDVEEIAVDEVDAIEVADDVDTIEVVEAVPEDVTERAIDAEAAEVHVEDEDDKTAKYNKLQELLEQQKTALELVTEICEETAPAELRNFADAELQLLDEPEVEEGKEQLAKENEERENFAFEVERTRKVLDQLGVPYGAKKEVSEEEKVAKEKIYRRTPLKRLRKLNTLASPKSATRRDHDHVLQNLRTAFNDAVRYFATLNAAATDDMYVAEMGSAAILQKYDNLFLEIEQKLPVKQQSLFEDEEELPLEEQLAAADGEEAATVAKASVEQFPDMLIQLAEMLRSQKAL